MTSKTEAALRAINALVNLLDSQDEQIRLRAATTLLEHTLP